MILVSISIPSLLFPNFLIFHILPPAIVIGDQFHELVVWISAHEDELVHWYLSKIKCSLCRELAVAKDVTWFSTIVPAELRFVTSLLFLLAINWWHGYSQRVDFGLLWASLITMPLLFLNKCHRNILPGDLVVVLSVVRSCNCSESLQVWQRRYQIPR